MTLRKEYGISFSPDGRLTVFFSFLSSVVRRMLL